MFCKVLGNSCDTETCMEAEQGKVGGVEIGVEPSQEIDIRELGLRRFIDLIVIINPIFFSSYINI